MPDELPKPSTDADAKAKRRATEFFKMLPIVGRPIAWTVEEMGAKGPLVLLIGFVLAAVLVGVGWWPEWAINHSYKSSRTLHTRTAVVQLEKQIVSVPAPWLAYLRYWLEREGDRLRDSRTIDGYMVGQVETQILPATYEFVYVLQPSAGFSLEALAFRVDATGRFEPLIERRSSSSDNFRHFVVPEGDPGGKLVALIRVQWKPGQTTGEFSTTFHSSALPRQ